MYVYNYTRKKMFITITSMFLIAKLFWKMRVSRSNINILIQKVSCGVGDKIKEKHLSLSSMDVVQGD
jgi:hypothetical protein